MATEAERGMYQRMLLAYDGSAEGRAALREGALLARRYGSAIFLLAAAPVPSAAYFAEGAASGAIGQMEEHFQRILEEGLERLRGLGFEAEGAVASGEPAKVIAAYAKRTQADLVVLGHRRQNIIDRWWTGPAGGYLSDHLECSLLICRNVLSDEQLKAELARLDGAASKGG